MSILERIEDERVFSVALAKNKKTVTIEEMCDRLFEVDLTKSELLQLCEELKGIANQMQD